MAYNYSNYQQPIFTGYGQQYPTQNFTGYNPNATPNPYQSQQQAQMPLQYSTMDFVVVKGEDAVNAYPVAAGNSVRFMDSEEPTLYIKSTDNMGHALPLEIYDIVKRGNNSEAQAAPQPQIDLSEYVKISDLEAKVKEMTKEALDEFLIKKEVKK